MPVRYDPFDAGTAFAFIRNRWVPCHSEYYCGLRGRSEKEIMLATQELHKQHSSHSQIFKLNAKRLAEFLQSVEAKEALLLQRACDREAREALEGVGGQREVSDLRPGDSGEETPRTSSPYGAPSEEVHEEYGEF